MVNLTNLTPIDSENCELFRIDDFRKMVKVGAVNDQDGSGFLANETHYSEDFDVFGKMPKLPDDERKKLGKVFTHVVWFSK